VIRHAEDLTGRQYSGWTVLGRAELGYRTGRGIVWHCQCKCGAFGVVTGCSLKNGRSTRCRRCGDKERLPPKKINRQFKDLTGLTFSRWTVLGLSHRNLGHIYWLCRCDCGMERAVTAASLLCGGSKSCGCRPRRARPKKPSSRKHAFPGQIFGELRAVKKVSDSEYPVFWLCDCLCGNSIVLRENLLLRRRYYNCGCAPDPRYNTARMSAHPLYGTWQGMNEAPMYRCKPSRL